MPTKKELNNPHHLKNIDLARDKIVKAIHNNERIAIFNDPDCDGCVSTAIIFNYIRNFTDNISYFSNQRSSGHGVNTSLHLVPKETDLLIIVDSSSSDVKACGMLSLSGIDIVILDHHLIEQENPFCTLVNPQQQGDKYPNKKISGSVVAWKMTEVLDEVFGTNFSNDYIDLAAIGLLGDQMNMFNEYENRYIVQRGLKNKNIKNKGLKSLISTFGKDINNLTSTDILYSVSPALNSACRLDKIEVALSLLTEEDPKFYKQLAKDIVKLNDQRKVIQAQYYTELVDMVNPSDKCSIIIASHVGAGYRGLIAGDLSSKFSKPVMILSETEDDTYKGSYRSNDFDLKSVLNSIPEVIYAAGHPSAGGVCFKRSDLKSIQVYLNEHLPSFNKDSHLEYMLEFDIDEVDEKLINDVEEFYRINGNGFNVGLFKINNIHILDKKVLGKEKNTIKLEACHTKQKHMDTATHCLMKFRTDESYISDKYVGKEISAIGSLNLNIWKNQRTGVVTKTKQIFIEDFQLVY